MTYSEGGDLHESGEMWMDSRYLRWKLLIEGKLLGDLHQVPVA